MRYTELPIAATGLPRHISVLGFGCAPLLGRTGRSQSLAALHAAFDGGINFYDTARSYGYGESETLLGEFLAGRRDKVVLCTKFGILPAARGGWKQRVKPLAQAAVRAFPQLRGFARQQAAGQMVAGQFTTANLRTSLETSLRELRTDYVDMLLMHDAPASVLDDGELLQAMGQLVEQGKVRMAGISGGHGTIAATLQARPPMLTTAQFALDPKSFPFLPQIADANGMVLVGNHPFGGAQGVGELKARIQQMREDVGLPPQLRDKLHGDAGELMPEIVFGCILRGTGIAAVVAAMTSLPNLARNLRAIEQSRFSDDEIALLRARLAQPANIAAR